MNLADLAKLRLFAHLPFPSSDLPRLRVLLRQGLTLQRQDQENRALAHRRSSVVEASQQALRDRSGQRSGKMLRSGVKISRA
jgi:hypothetical protein